MNSTSFLRTMKAGAGMVALFAVLFYTDIWETVSIYYKIGVILVILLAGSTAYRYFMD